MPEITKPPFVKNKTELGELLRPKCGERWISTLLIRGMPGKGPDGYDVAACQKWCDENRSAKKPEFLASADTDGLSARQKAELRKILADAEWRELRNKKANDELVDAAEVRHAVGEFCCLVRDRLQAIPEEVCCGMAPETRVELERQWSDKMRWILTAMSHWRLDKECLKGLDERMKRFDDYERENPPPKELLGPYPHEIQPPEGSSDEKETDDQPPTD